jgi:4-hydroxybenzoate polyprenyltransferase
MWDRKYDAAVQRTRDRPLASGLLTLHQARPIAPSLCFCKTLQAAAWLGAQCSVGLLVLLQLPPAAVALGCVSVLPVLLYPLAKRFVKWPQVRAQTLFRVC